MNFTAFKSVALASTLVAGASAFAQNVESQSQDPYFEIGSVEVREIETDLTDLDESRAKPEISGIVGEIRLADVMLGRIINMGRKVWAIVEAGRPVVDVQSQTANALPQGADHWNKLQGWSLPQWKTYQATYRNLYRAKVVEFVYRVGYTSGGNVEGKGRFLTNVSVVPTTVDVAWGYNVDVEASVPSVVNAGTSSDPIGQMELLVKWTVKTVMKHSENSMGYAIRGDGQFIEMQ